MKKFLFTLLFLLPGAALLQAQKAEPVYSFAVVSKPLSFYRDQIQAWKKEINQNPRNGLAWYYYYYATRNILRTDTSDKRSQQTKDSVLIQLVDEMGKNIPGSYEYHLCMWMNHGFDMSYLPHLEKVFELGKGRTEHLSYVMNMGEIRRNRKQRDEGARLKTEAGLISPGMLYYNHNVLSGLPDKAILLTAGDNDTYPAWVIQSKGIKADIHVINLSLLMVDDYRNKLFDELGVAPVKINWDDTKAYENFMSGIVTHLATNKKNLPVYVAVSALHGPFLSSKIENNLYLTGLAYLYSEKPIDEKALLKRNFEQHYSLDYIRHAYYQDISSELVLQINLNYVVPLIRLYEHYQLSEDQLGMKRCRELLQILAENSSDKKSILDLIR